MRVRKLLLALMLAALTAAWAFACAEADGARRGSVGAAQGPDAASGADAIAVGELRLIDLDAGPRALTFTPQAGSVYDVCVFPADESDASATVRLTQGRAALAEGEGLLTVISERLSAGTTYGLTLSGEGRVRLEVARHALSRCFDQPLRLEADGDRYSKAIARSGDAHWYAVAPSGGRPVALAGVPAEAGPRLDAQLFDASGHLLAEATRTVGGACLMDFVPEDGEVYRVRVSSPNAATGLYDLRVGRGAGGMPEAVVLSDAALTVHGRETRTLTARVNPAGASGLLYWESSDTGVAVVDAGGAVTGRRSGTAVVTAYATGSVLARCRVEVVPVPAEGVELLARRIEMSVGDDAALEWRLTPENASDPRVAFEVSPAGVVEIGADGVLRAVGEGEAVVTVRTADGGYEASAPVSVAPAAKRYRALLVGEQHYAATVASERLGSANSVAGMRSMLGELSFDGARFGVTTRLDATRDGVLRAIRDAFDGAAAQDVSLFYITCHGYYSDGMTCFQMYDGSVLTAAELRLALNDVPGEIVLLADCCGSGGVIGRAGTPDDILKGVGEVFGGTAGPSLFEGSRFRVLASASVEQDSYRVSFSADAAESDMATVFARAVCEGAGWDIDRGGRSAMRADVDYDNAVTLDELYRYAARRVMWYLSLGGGGYVQTVQVGGEGDVRPLFRRS